MHQRIAEIGTEHRAVVDHPVIGPVIDDGTFHGLGYSLESATLMASSIAAVNIAAMKSHCYANAAKDPLFCKSPSLSVRMFHVLQTIGKDTNQTTKFGDYRQDAACSARWPRPDPATNLQEN